jgi:predicted DNA-binding transcriptional regulator AlpA
MGEEALHLIGKDSALKTYITLKELSAKLGNRSRSAIYLDLAAGRLPPPIKLGGRLYWPEGDVDAHLRNLRDEAA